MDVRDRRRSVTTVRAVDGKCARCRRDVVRAIVRAVLRAVDDTRRARAARSRAERQVTGGVRKERDEEDGMADDTSSPRRTLDRRVQHGLARDLRRPVQPDRVLARQGRAARRDRRFPASTRRCCSSCAARPRSSRSTCSSTRPTRASAPAPRASRRRPIRSTRSSRSSPPATRRRSCTFAWNASFPGRRSARGNAATSAATASAASSRACRQKFTFFSPEGVPLRATLTLTLREYKTLDEQLTQLNLSSPDRTHAPLHAARATRCRASPRATTRGRASGGRSPTTTTSTIRAGSMPGALLTVPSIR